MELKKRFEKLTEKRNPINEILDIWEKDGIEKAMLKYYEIDEDDKEIKKDRILIATL